MLRAALMDPMELKALLWPDVYFYDKQREIIYSVCNDRETYVPAGNKLGKDFVAAFIALYFFLTRKPVRIVTTSAKDDHLKVLWGEIERFIARSKFPLKHTEGGPLVVNHRHIRKRKSDGTLCPISYMIGMVASNDTLAAMQGHHANPDTVEEANDGVPRTLFMSDESSSVPDPYYDMVTSWAKRMLIFGNAWECENFFKRGVKGGNVLSPDGKTYSRRVIKITAQDSPNVRYGIAQEKLGRYSNEILVPGVKDYAEYLHHRATLDPIKASVILDAEFYEGREVKMFPAPWLQRCRELAKGLRGRKRVARAIGIDPAEGGDKTAMCAVDEWGIVELVSRKTPNTAEITAEAKAFIRKHQVAPENVYIDRGGGGKQHADRLRDDGYPVQTVSFGEPLSLEIRTGMRLVEEKIDLQGERYQYVNRRAQLYGQIRQLIDPSLRFLHECLDDVSPHWDGFAIPDDTPECRELLRQLAPIPLKYDREGRLKLLSKNKPNPESTEPTLTELLGCSPDEADALALSIHGMVEQGTVMKMEAIA